MGKHDDEHSYRAQIALRSIHEARKEADKAIDALMQAHQSDDGSGGGQAKRAKTEQHAHIAVMRLYNRLRPYILTDDRLAHNVELYVETTEDGRPIEVAVKDEKGDPVTENGRPVTRRKGIYGLQSLDAWRLATTT
ncbi:hypothetical protein, partial [Halomarina oriensis]